MFHSILVPLDGSAFAEQALPLAVNVARRAGAVLHLVRVHFLYALNGPASAWLPFDPAQDAAMRRQEEEYLRTVAGRLTETAAPPTHCLAQGLEADGIVKTTRERRADLIVMTTHGRGPLSRFFLGSTADEVVRTSPVPVLLVRPQDPPAAPVVSNVIVPLDGSELAESVLPAAAALARLLDVPCTLLRVIESRPHAHATAHLEDLPLEPEMGEARSYLRRIAERLHDRSPGADTRVVIAPHAAGAILDAEHSEPGALIALATHGRGGVRRMLLGSVADKVIRGAMGPVLVYRPR